MTIVAIGRSRTTFRSKRVNVGRDTARQLDIISVSKSHEGFLDRSPALAQNISRTARAFGKFDEDESAYEPRSTLSSEFPSSSSHFSHLEENKLEDEERLRSSGIENKSVLGMIQIDRSRRISLVDGIQKFNGEISKVRDARSLFSFEFILP